MTGNEDLAKQKVIAFLVEVMENTAYRMQERVEAALALVKILQQN